MLPKVSVVIPCYNCRYIDETIESVLYQTYSSVEIIVIDDGSTMFVEKMNPYLKHVRYYRKENGGTATALNAGIRRATGQYVAWLSSDDLWYPHKLEKQVQLMRSQQAIFTFTNFDVYVQSSNKIKRRIVAPITTKKAFAQRFLNECAVNGCTILAQRSLFHHVGLFNERLPFTHDYEMWVRILLSGTRMEFLDESLTLYRLHNEMGSMKHSAKQIKEFNVIKQKYRKPLLRYIEKS